MDSKHIPFWVKKIDGKEITIITKDEIDVDNLLRWSASDVILGELRFDDKRELSSVQRGKAYALIGEVADHFEIKRHESKDLLKKNYRTEYDAGDFSFSNCSVSTARDFISSTIEFCFLHDVPFKTKGMELADDINRYLWLCIKYRKCALCGKKGDVAHYETVGMGRDRKKIDHSQHRFMCLCRTHHTEQHRIGLHTFCNKYLIQGVKLSAENIKEFRI